MSERNVNDIINISERTLIIRSIINKDMTQKVLKVGSSAAVTIPKKSLKELGIKVGDEISVEVDRRKREVHIRANDAISLEDAKIARLTMNFIRRYRKDLEALARA